jgi:hypothetical protein
MSVVAFAARTVSGRIIKQYARVVRFAFRKRKTPLWGRVRFIIPLRPGASSIAAAHHDPTAYVPMR